LNWYWVIAFLLNDIVIFYTGYLLWQLAERKHFYGVDSKILHCETCGRPEIVPYFAIQLKDCSYCSGYLCPDCDDIHFQEDDGYNLKNKKNKKVRKNETSSSL